MRAFKILGPCLAMALVALVGTTASASASLKPPVWEECVKAKTETVEWKEGAPPKEKTKTKTVYTGVYSTKLCNEKATPAEGPIRAKGTNPGPEGKYERRAPLTGLIGAGKTIKGKAVAVEGIAASLHVKTPIVVESVTCTSAKSESGVAEAPNREKNVKIAYKGCKVFGNKECKSTAPAGGKEEIKTKALDGELGYVKEAEPVEVGLRLEAEEAEAPSAVFVCNVKGKEGEIHAEVGGQVIGVVSGDINVASKASTLTDLPGEFYGTHMFDEKEYKPTVNIIGWGSEVAGILAAEEANEEETDPAHVLKTTFCGTFIELFVHEECTPPAYVGLEQTIEAKGEAALIRAEE
jgi:hypothetical protein